MWRDFLTPELLCATCQFSYLSYVCAEKQIITYLKAKVCTYPVSFEFFSHKEDLDSFVNDLDDKINNRKILKFEKNPPHAATTFQPYKVKAYNSFIALHYLFIF